MKIPRRFQSFGRQLDFLLDEIIRALRDLEAGPVVAGNVETFFNGTDSAVERHLLYGFDDGILAAAVGGASSVEPLMQSLAFAGAGKEFPVKVIGRTRVLLEDPSVSVAVGGWGWLSTTPGKVTPSLPSSGARYRVCQFASTAVNRDGSVEAWLFLFPQSGGVI